MRIEMLYKAQSLDDALAVKQEDSRNVILGAGLWLKRSKRKVHKAIDLSLLNLDHIEVTKNTIKIGAYTPLKVIEDHKALKALYQGVLSDAIHHIMGIQLRNMATLGGSIIGRYGFSDIITPLLCMDVTLYFHLQGAMSLETFLASKGATDDILTHIEIPIREGSGYFKKCAPSPLSFSSLNITVTKVNNDYKVAVGSRPSIGTLAKQTSVYLSKQKSISDDVIEQAKRYMLEDITLGSNVRASESYRQTLMLEYLNRALKAVNA